MPIARIRNRDGECSERGRKRDRWETSDERNEEMRLSRFWHLNSRDLCGVPLDRPIATESSEKERERGAAGFAVRGLLHKFYSRFSSVLSLLLEFTLREFAATSFLLLPSYGLPFCNPASFRDERPAPPDDHSSRRDALVAPSRGYPLPDSYRRSRHP